MSVNFWPSDKDGNWLCMVCGEKMPEGYEPPTCCSGHECGCMGQPTEPNICSTDCWNIALQEKREKELENL